jgi:asparagine synthase (glutamine-hydrolysing)
MAICGIVVNRDARPMEEPVIEAMVSALAVQKHWPRERHVEREISFGATSPTASTSLWKSEQLAVVCDGDISNERELRSELTSCPEGTNPACLLGQLYLDRKTKLLEGLNGFFSLAIWDRSSRTLLLAADRFGVKPLYYSATSAGIVFASQSRGILASDRIAKHVNPHAIVSYLTYSVVPSPLSAFEGIEKLPPGNFLVWQDGTVRTARYWEMEYPEDAMASEKELARQLLEQMGDAVNRSSRDVPSSELGCFLSGGTDSSSVVGLLTRLRKSSVNTVSIGFEEDRFNELDYAHIAVKHFDSGHVQARLGPSEAFRILPEIVALFDEPYANASAIPTYFCQALAAERGIKVMLAGDGGDELFAGNERYATDRTYQLYQTIPNALRRGFIEPIASLIPPTAPGIGKARRYVQSSNVENPDRYFRWMMLQYFGPDKILGSEMPFRNGNSDLLAIARGHYKSAHAKSELNRLLYIDVKMTLGDNDLPKVVRASELAGINVRFPFLDHHLADFSGRIPARLKLKGFEKRYLFKRATRHLLPKAILQKRKHGFGLPIGVWLKSNTKFREMAEDILRSPRTYQRGYFRREFIDDLFARLDQDNTTFFGDLLYVFLMLELWNRKHVDA